MALIILTIFTLVLYPIFNSFISNKEKAKKFYFVFLCLLFIFFIGFRSKNIGTDTPGYVNIFLSANKISWELIISLLREKEFGFYIFQSLVRTFTQSYTIFLTLIAILYMVPVAFFVYKHSKIPYISFILFMSMGYMNFAMAGLRQTMAASFLIIAFNYIFEKKYIKFLIFVLIASMFHITSLIFLVALFIGKSSIKVWHLIATGVACILCSIYGSTWLLKILEYVWGESRNYHMNEFGGYSTLVLFILVAIAALVFNKNIMSKERRKENEDAYFFKFLLISIPFQLLAIYQANCFRVAMYFSIFGMLTTIPKALSIQNDKSIKIFGIIIVIILLLVQTFAFTYWSSDVNPYEFFWQVM